MTYSDNWKNDFEKLEKSGVHIRTFDSNAALYIHAKMISVDEKIAFVGSENFSETSLNDNRELGIILTDKAIINSLSDIFIQDWKLARPFVDVL